MANKIIPTKVKINGKWYNTREGFGSTVGMLELSDSGKISQITEFTAKEPYAHINDFYFVFDTDGNKVGEIDINNNKCSGCVSDFEISGSYNAEDSRISSSRHFPRSEKKYGCLSIIFAIFVFVIFRNWGGKIGTILGGIFTIIIVVGSKGENKIVGAFFGVLIMVVLGLIGVAIGGIVKLIIKNSKK